MATVHLARQEGIGGFQKLVVIKRICDSLSFDRTYATLFLDEARLAAQLQHPNIAQITDIGKDDKGLFMVMEYLEGESLDYILAKLTAKGTPLDPAFVCRIGTSVAAGLHHAHTSMDSRGKATPVIHRDVTPSNIIVCFNGVVKLVDFGIAKSVHRTSQTEAGQIRGKVAYMAPEQILEQPLTPATDVFQLGIVLHEALTCAPLFRRGSTHRTTMALMYDDVRPPSAIQPSAPVVLDDIIMQALERDPAKRQASAEVLRQQLDQAAKRIGPTTGDHELSSWMQTVFDDRYAQRRDMARAALSLPTGPVHSDPGELTPESADIISLQSQASALPDSASISTGDIFTGTPANGGYSVVDSGQLQSTPASYANGSASDDVQALLTKGLLGRPMFWGVATVAVALGAFLAYHSINNGASEPRPPVVVGATVPPATFRVHLETIPPNAVITLNERKVAVGLFDRELTTRQRPYRVTVSAAGYHSKEFAISAATDTLVKLEPNPQDKPTASKRTASDTATRKKRTPAKKAVTKRPAKDDEERGRHLKTDILDPWTK